MQFLGVALCQQIQAQAIQRLPGQNELFRFHLQICNT